MRIEKVLNRVPGTQAAVNYATESAAVRFDPARAGVDDLVGAVAKAGYTARVKKDVQAERAEVQARRDASLKALRHDVIIASLSAARSRDAPDADRGAHAEWGPRWLQMLLATRSRRIGRV